MPSATAERWQRQLDAAGPAALTVGVIGDPVTHSLSPQLHMAAFAALGLAGRSLPFTVPAGKAAEAIDTLRTLGLRGLSVTMPHKEAVVGLVDAVSEAAGRLAAANCLVNDDGYLSAHTTDGDGLIRSLEQELGWAPAGQKAVVVGGGGAARAVIEGLSRAGVTEIAVINRSAQRAEAAAAVGGPVTRVGGLEDLGSADLVINATPVGMAESPGLPTPIELFRPHHLVVDLIYQPATTEWLRGAAGAKATAVNGVPMLLYQAAIQIELWTGMPAPVAAMRAAVADHLTPPGANSG